MEGDMEQKKDDIEQVIHEMETREGALKSELEERDRRLAGLVSTNETLQHRLDQAMTNLTNETAARRTAEAKAEEGARVLADKEAAVGRVDQLMVQAKAQEDSFDALAKELEKLQSKLRTAVREAEDAKDGEEAKSRELASVSRRSSSLEEQVAELERELDGRTKALAAYRGEKSQELMEALGRLSAMEKKANDNDLKAGEATRTADSLRARLARTEAHLKEAEEGMAIDKTALEKQISLQETLTNLQKDKADEAMKKIASLQDVIRGLQDQVAAERTRAANERKRVETVRGESKAVVEELEAKLKEKEAELTKAAGVGVGAAHNQMGGGGDAMEADPVPLDLSVDLDTLSDTELKMRLMKMERELEYVRSDRDRNVLYLTRILREVEQKSPLLMNNKKDYQRVLQSHDQLFLKVEASMRRCQKAEMERELAAKARDRIEQELGVTKDSLADLGAQVQKLLKDKLERDLGRPLDNSGGGSDDRYSKQAAGSAASAPAPAGNVVPQDLDQVISDHLVTFQDIRELQERNRSLVQVVRQMTAELKDAKASKGMEQGSIDERVVQEMQRQLDELKESRERQDEMLVTVKNARDMYRVLLAQETNKDMAASSAGGGGGGSSAAQAAAEQELEAMKSRVHELERDLGVARDESKKLQQSLRLMGDEVTTAERAQSKATADCVSANRLLSHAQDQVKTLTADRSSRIQEIELASSRFMTLSDSVIRLQTQLEQQKNDALDAHAKAKDVGLTNQGLRADKRILEAAESQLRSENDNLRKEIKQKNSLLSKLSEMDRSTKAREQAELSALQDELARVRRQAEEDRRKRADAELEAEKSASRARESARELESRVSALKAESQKATAAAAAAAASEKVAAQKAIELSARLNEARARLVTGGSVGGVGGGGGDGGSGLASSVGPDDGVAGQLAEVGKLQMELQSLKAELKAKKDALSTNERQRKQYEAMAKSKQLQLDQLRSASEKAEESWEIKVKETLAKVEAAEAEARSAKTGLASTVDDLVKEKEAMEAESRDLRKRIVKLNDDMSAAKTAAEYEANCTEELKKEVELQRSSARASEERYRQELEAHAGAITALRQAENAQDAAKKKARDALHAKDRLVADMVGARAQWEAQEALLKKACTDTEERLSSLNSQHEILTTLFQNLTKEMEALQAKREEEDRAVADRVAEGGAGAGAAGEGGEGGKGGEDNAEAEEKMRLARSVKELTELVRHKGRDVQMVTTDLELSKQIVTKLKAELERTKQSLLDAREEVQRAATESIDAVSKAEHRKLMDEVAQVSTLRESNEMLRSKLGDSERRNRLAQDRLSELRMKMAPLQQAQRQQSASSAALVSEKESLRKEVDNWKKRVTSLTASFNAVDPKDHEEVVAEKERLTNALAEADKAKAVLESSNTDLARAKAMAEKQRDDANTAKNKLAPQVQEMKKMLSIAAAQKAAATRDLEAKLNAEKEKISKAATEAASLRQEAARARANANSATAGVTKQLNEQVAKAKAEAESLRTQLRQALSTKDSTGQIELLRKNVASLEQAIEAKDRENVTNRTMYDNMKGVSRKIKENLATAQQEVKDKNDQISKLEARITQLEGESTAAANSQGTAAPSSFSFPSFSSSSSSSSSPPTTITTTTTTTAAGTETPGGGFGTRPSTSVTPALPSQQQRGLSPSRIGRSGMVIAEAGAGAGAGGGLADDGGEASLRNRLMARTKRPLAPATDASAGPTKRPHKPSDEAAAATPTSGVRSGGGITALTGSSSSAPAAGTTTFGSSFTATTPAPSPLSTASPAAATSTAGSTAKSPAPAPAPTGFGAFAAGVGGRTFGSSTSLNPGAKPFGFSGAGWGGAPSAASSSSTLGASAGGSTVGKFGGMVWGNRPAATSSSSSSATSTSSSTAPKSAAVAPTTATFGSASSLSTSASAATTPSSAAVASSSTGAGATIIGGTSSTGSVTMKHSSGGAGNGGVDAAAGGGNGGGAGAAATKSIFGGGTGFAGFGGGGGFGSSSSIASMKPPSSAPPVSPFPSGHLPVPSPSTLSPSKTPTTAFGVTPLGTTTASTTTTTSTGGGGGGGQMKFGLSPATVAPGAAPPSFGSAVPMFGRPVTSARTTATSPAASGPPAAAGVAPAAATSTPPAAIFGSKGTTTSTTGSAGGENRGGAPGDGAAAAAAAGVPGPAALRLDVEARRAAREKRFAAQPPASSIAAVTEKGAATGAASLNDASGAAPEEGEIDEDDEGDPV